MPISLIPRPPSFPPGSPMMQKKLSFPFLPPLSSGGGGEEGLHGAGNEAMTWELVGGIP